MGIKGLTKLIADNAPDALSEDTINNYFGRKIAIDASMSLYQFIIAVRPEMGMLTDEVGETTSHLQGMFYRTIRLLKNGIKPAYVFDGKPPEMKSGELTKRYEKRKDAEAKIKEARESGTDEDVQRFLKQTTRVTQKQTEECKKLLRLMGVPVVEAPCEAEAQCAALCKAGKVYGTGSEDTDSLTVGSPILLRHLTFSEAKKMPILEMNLAKTLEGLGLSMDEFIDLCILLGCDYCDKIKGIGPKKAIELIQKHKTIEKVLKNIDKKKYIVPNGSIENWLQIVEQTRALFREPPVDPDTEEMELEWKEPNEEELIKYLVEEKNFDENRVKGGIAKLKSCRQSTVQGRLDGFFTVTKSPSKKRPAQSVLKNKNKRLAVGAKKPAMRRK